MPPGVSDTLVVTQTPAVSVMELEAATISCCWTGTFDRLSVKWLKNGTTFVSENTISKNKCRGSPLKDRCRCTTLPFMKITRKQSGTYICRVTVDIPVYDTVEGNGTVVTVKATEDTGRSEDAGRQTAAS